VNSRRGPAPRRARKGGGSLTLADVARLAKVSPITVSRALNTPDQLARETLERVQQAVERTGYVPNRMAGGLASARSRLIFATVPTIAGLVFLETVQALTDALTQEGYEVVLGQSGYDNAREDDLLDAIIGRRPDGVILTGVMHSPLGRKRLAAAGIPVVETWDLTPTPIDMLVGFSHEKVGAAAAEFLHARGAKRPAMICADDTRAGMRRAGYMAACERLFGVVPPARVVSAPTNLGRGRRALSALLERWPDIDAVFCSSDVLAHGVLTEAMARGIDIPGQLRVFGFGDLDFAADLHPSLSTVRVDGTAIGRQAARFVIDRAEGRAVENRIVDIGFTVVARDSA
jgi:LacI family gluconate utilization system Gnt-I transcriptional repressor